MAGAHSRLGALDGLSLRAGVRRERGLRVRRWGFMASGALSGVFLLTSLLLAGCAHQEVRSTGGPTPSLVNTTGSLPQASDPLTSRWPSGISAVDWFMLDDLLVDPGEFQIISLVFE